jgi:hypothetical protein
MEAHLGPFGGRASVGYYATHRVGLGWKYCGLLPVTQLNEVVELLLLLVGLSG